MSSWHSYPSIYNLGHRAISELLFSPVVVEEKIDGSQFSFGLFQEMEPEGALRGEIPGAIRLRVRSKGAEMLVDAPEKMFTKAVETVENLAEQLHIGWTYRGEYLAKPKHNTLCYDRIPNQHIILFDINTEDETYLSYEEKQVEAARLGLEVVPKLFEGMLTDINQFRQFLQTQSVLGGQLIEGVVVKPVGYQLFGRDKKCLLGKFVSEAFKESHKRAWKETDPKSGDILERLIDAYTSPARWQKAVQHLREAGQLEESPRDIPKLIKEIPQDIEKECREEIAEKLFAWAWPHIRRGVTKGFPEWWKEQLLKQQFEEAA